MCPRQRREEQGLGARSSELLQVLLDVREDMRRDVHVSHPGLRLGRPDGGLPVRPGDSAAHPDQAFAKIDVCASRLSDLAVSEGAPGAQ